MRDSLRDVFFPSPTRDHEASPVEAPRPRWRLGLAVAVAALVATFLWLAYRRAPSYLNQYDDAYITFRYALNWARGNGLVFNVGEPTDGASSLLYAFLLACAYKIGFIDLERVSFSIGVGAAAGVAGIVTWFGCARPRAWLPSVGLGIMAGLHGFISGWAVSGMETSLYAFLTAAITVRLLTNRAGSVATGVLIAAAVLTRFEACIFVVGWIVLAVRRYPMADGGERRALFIAATIVSTSAAVLAVFKLLTYGTVVPQAFVLKRILRYYQSQPYLLAALWGAHAPIYALLGVGGLARLWRARPAAAPAMTIVIVGAISSVLFGPYSDGGRYSVYLLPIFVLLTSDIVSAAWGVLPGVCILLLAFLALEAKSSFQWMKSKNDAFSQHQVCRKRVGVYLREHVTDEPVLSSDIGAIAYSAPDVRFVDVTGLTSAAVSDAFKAGHNLDALLAVRRPLLVADTLSSVASASEARYSAFEYIESPGQTMTPLPPSRLAPCLRVGAPVSSCESSTDGIRFGVSTLSYDESGPCRLTTHAPEHEGR